MTLFENNLGMVQNDLFTNTEDVDLSHWTPDMMSRISLQRSNKLFKVEMYNPEDVHTYINIYSNGIIEGADQGNLFSSHPNGKVRDQAYNNNIILPEWIKWKVKSLFSQIGVNYGQS